jgi:hypothetical protein
MVCIHCFAKIIVGLWKIDEMSDKTEEVAFEVDKEVDHDKWENKRK